MDYISETANALGVSRQTVYRALAHSQYISTKTRERVTEYVKQNYPEKIAARRELENARRTGKIHITVIMPFKPQYFWNNAIQGMENAIRAVPQGSIEVKYVFYSGTLSETELLTALDEVDVTATDALAIVPVDTEKVAKKIRELSQTLPVALFNEYCHNCGNYINIISNGYDEGSALARLLLESEKSEKNSCILVLLSESYKGRIVSERTDGFINTIKQYDKNSALDVVERCIGYSGDAESDEEYNYNTILPSLIARIIAAHINSDRMRDKKISSIYIPNGNLLPLFIALRKLDMLDVRVYGHEINPRSLQFYHSGIKGGYVKEDIYMQGYVAIQSLASRLLKNKNIYPDNYITRFDICTFV